MCNLYSITANHEAFQYNRFPRRDTTGDARRAPIAYLQAKDCEGGAIAAFTVLGLEVRYRRTSSIPGGIASWEPVVLECLMVRGDRIEVAHQGMILRDGVPGKTACTYKMNRVTLFRGMARSP